MKTTIKVVNIKCGGCANSIHRSLAALTGVFGVDVNLESGGITVDHTDEVTREQLAAKLLSMGYPEEGTAPESGDGSFVSCTAGRTEK